MSLRVTLTVKKAATVAVIQARVASGEDLPHVLNELLDRAVCDGKVREEVAQVRGELTALHAESERLHATIRALGSAVPRAAPPAAPHTTPPVAGFTFAVEEDDGDVVDVLPLPTANPWD